MFIRQFAHPRIDPGDTSAQSHIFLGPPARSERVVYTSAIDVENVKKQAESKVSNILKRKQI